MNAVVLGAGSIGRRHIGNLRALGVEQLTVSDCDSAALDRVVRDFGVTATDNWRAALAGRCDAVFVCTPTDMHLAMARAALEAGAHVFVEKPLSVSLDGVADLVALARASRRVTLVGCNMRFHPGLAAIKRALDEGIVTDPLYFHARFSHYLPNWRPGQDYRTSYSARLDQGGGIMLEAVHEVDYLQWLAGGIRRITAHTRRLSDLEIHSEDYAIALLEFETGAAGLVHVDYLSPLKLRGCEVVGTGGVLRWYSEGKAPEAVHVQHFDRRSGGARELYANPAYDGNAMYVDELGHFLRCIEGSEAPLLDFADAARVLELTLTCRTDQPQERCGGRV